MNELRQLIVNADDYGVTRNVSLGIREAHQQGIVRTVSSVGLLETYDVGHPDRIIFE